MYKRIKPNIICFVLMSVFSYADQPLLQKIEIHGNRVFSDSKLISSISFQANEKLPDNWPDNHLQSFVRMYHDEGYYLFRIDSLQQSYNKDSTQVKIQLYLTEGEKLRLSEFTLRLEDPFLSAKLKSLMDLRAGDPFNDYLLENDSDAMLTWLGNNGYPLAEIMIDTLQVVSGLEKQSLKVILQVETGPKVFLNDIQVSGNKYTQTKYIQRELRLKSGEVYRQNVINESADHLRRLSIFKDVKSPNIRFQKDKANILYEIEEGNASLLDGVLGYIPPKGTQKEGTITGRLQFEFRNLFGTGRYLEAYWEKKDRYSQAMRFGYTESWILDYPIEAGFQFEQEIRDTTYLERSWRIPISWAPRNTISLSVEGGQREILPDSLGSLVYDVPRTSTWFFSLRGEYNTFDNLLNPGKGVHYHTLFTVGRKRNIGPDYLIEAESLKDRVETRRIEIDAEAVLPVLNRQVVYAGLHGAEVKTGDERVAISDQIRFGGAKTLRGYEEDFFRGTLVTWMNLEYRYFLGRQSRAFVFWDTGYFQRKKRIGFGTPEGCTTPNSLISDWKTGYGFGIRLETGLGLLGIDYGLGEGDGPLQGKVHVGLVNRF